MTDDLWDEPPEPEPEMGPVFAATYESDADCCGDRIVPGEDIRGYRGGWIHADTECEKLAQGRPALGGRCPRCTAIHAGEC